MATDVVPIKTNIVNDIARKFAQKVCILSAKGLGHWHALEGPQFVHRIYSPHREIGIFFKRRITHQTSRATDQAHFLCACVHVPQASAGVAT